jgi:two-component system OmpR family sensor kinase
VSAGVLVRRSVARLRWAQDGRRTRRRRYSSALLTYRPELLWGLFAGVNYAAMVAFPTWETIPFHFVWISLTVLYGFRVWPLRFTVFVLACVMALTGASIGLDAFRGLQLWGELFEVPLMAAMFLAMVWHARRRVAALAIAEERAEERRSLLERQERFVHDASHELRTPATIARGHLELIRSHGLEVPEVQVAIDELVRIDEILERLLLLATADQPGFVQRSELDLEPLLEDVFMRWAELAQRSWHLRVLAPGFLMADPGRLRAALDALLENAVKYSAPQDKVELRARGGEDGWVIIEIEDEGCGVPDQAAARIFDRFARADSARSRSAGGVGLGLAIVDAIAKAHGGECRLSSSGQGSTFALRLPGFNPAASASSFASAVQLNRNS